mgnify:FL=1
MFLLIFFYDKDFNSRIVKNKSVCGLSRQITSVRIKQKLSSVIYSVDL